MDTRNASSNQHRRVSRRTALALVGGAAASALLAACGDTTPAPPVAPAATGAMGAGAATRPASTAAMAVAATATPPPGSIRVPNTGAKLPTDKITFSWVDSGDNKAVFLREFFAQYQTAHPNITVQYQGLPITEVNKIVPLGIQNGNAPDVFQQPSNITAGQMVKEGWVRPIDDLVPNFAQWKARFPAGTFVEGVTDFGGKTYAAPYLSAKQYNSLLMYNSDLLQKAGFDPGAKPITFDEYRAAAKKVTEQGGGKAYGIILDVAQPDNFGAIVTNLARMAGAAGIGGIDLKTGKFNYTADGYLAAINLLLAVKADGSVLPGSVSLTTPDAQSRFPDGSAAMFMGGPFNVPQWQRQNPDFKFGVGSQPVPNTGTPIPLTNGPGPFIPVWTYAKSKYPEVAGDIYAYFGSDEGQAAEAALTKGFPPPIFPGAGQKAGLDPLVLKAYALFDQQIRTGPSPVVRNPDVTLVLLEQKSLTPNLSQTLQGLYTGQLSDPKKAMQDLQDRSEAELDRAIKAAQAKGAKVTRDDWAFPNWDPMKDYTDADYAALKK